MTRPVFLVITHNVTFHTNSLFCLKGIARSPFRVPILPRRAGMWRSLASKRRAAFECDIVNVEPASIR